MMKKPIYIIMMIIWLGVGTVGCSSLGELLAPAPGLHSHTGNGSLHPNYFQKEENDSQIFQVFQGNPYTLNLEFEEMETDFYQTPVNGDGGASLNAYAACLTLKVMF